MERSKSAGVGFLFFFLEGVGGGWGVVEAM